MPALNLLYFGGPIPFSALDRTDLTVKFLKTPTRRGRQEFYLQAVLLVQPNIRHGAAAIEFIYTLVSLDIGLH
jgi:hypothetical protein